MPAQKRSLPENLHHRDEDEDQVEEDQENGFDKEPLRPKPIRAEPEDESELLSREDGNQAKQQVDDDDDESSDDELNAM